LLLIFVAAAAVGLGSVPGRAEPPAEASLGAVAGASSLAIPAGPAAADPFPIMRLRLTEAQLPDAVKQMMPGAVVQMPRHEFEARVRRAGRVVAENQAVPRIVEARYTATLTGGDLSGDANWTILNPRSEGAVLPLDPLRIALQSPQWSGAGDAVVGHFGPGFPTEPCVWVPETGRQTLRAKWSAAGSGSAVERQFDLRLPPARAASLDLTLPAGLVPVLTTSDVLLTGPFPVKGNAGHHSWRLRFGDRTRLEFSVRGPGDPAAAGIVLASIAARYDLAPGQMSCSFEYDLRPSRGSVGEWAFALPSGVQVTNTVVNNRAGWQVDAGTRKLRVQLRQPGTGGKVLVTAVAPFPPPGEAAALPIIRPVGAIVGEEKIEVRIHPDLKLGVIEEADFRVTDSVLGTDQYRTVYLTGTLLPPQSSSAAREPPKIHVTGSEPEFATTEAVECRVRGQRIYLSVRLGVHVRRGDLFRLEVKSPKGFAFDRATATPADLVNHAGPLPVTGAAFDLARPLTAGQSAEFRLELRGPELAAGKPSHFRFPQVIPVGAAERDGWISFVAGPEWAVTARPSLPLSGANESRVALPPPPTGGTVFFYSGTTPEGDLTLAPVKPVFDSQAEVRLGLSPRGPIATYRYRFQVHSGVLSAITVFESSAMGEEPAWRVEGGANAVASVEKSGNAGYFATASLAGSGAAGWPAVLTTSGTGLATKSGTIQTIRLARPVAGEVILETVRAVGPELVRLQPELFDRTAFAVPLLDVAGVDLDSTRVTVEGSLADRVAARLDDGCIRVQPREPAGPNRHWSLDGLHLITVCTQPQTVAIFGGSITARGGNELSIGLPTGAEVTAACVDGYWLSPVQVRLIYGPGDPELRLPAPRGDWPIRFEVRYRLPAPAEGFPRRIASPVPTIAGEPGAVQRLWAMPRDVLAAWPLELRDSAAPTELPALAGDPLDRVLGNAAISPYSGDTIVVLPASVAVAAGWGLAAVIAAIAWAGATRARRLVGGLLILLLLAAGTAFILGPAAWQRAAMPVALVSAASLAAVVIAHGWRRSLAAAVTASRPGTSPDSRVRASMVGAALLAVLPLIASHAQPPRDDLVFILPGDGRNGEAVVAPRALLDKLDETAREVEPTTVITAADYQGRAEDGQARFEAAFQVHSFREGDSDVALPLADIRLKNMTVDGKPANPIATGPDLYTIRIPGRGRHKVKAVFTVPVVPIGPEREVKFGLPEVPVSHLAFTAPGGARQFQIVGRLGSEYGASGKDPVRLEAEIGGIKTAHIRWRQGAGGTATASVREGCVWDVGESGAVLTACYQVRVESGVATGFRFSLPAGLEPVRVAVRSLEAIAGPPLLREWTVATDKKGARTLRIDLASPVEGRLLITLECRPPGVLNQQPVLRFPRPVGLERRGGIYGLRANGVEIERVARSGVIDFAADALIREFGSVTDLRLSPMVPVLAFSPRLDQAAELRPALVAAVDPGEASQEVVWRVGPTGPEGSGVLRWDAARPLPFLEFALTVPLREVRGADVDRWSQAGSRVQVWFRKPVPQGEIEWRAGDPKAAPKAPRTPFIFEPPVPVPVGIKPAERSLEVLPPDGWAMRVERDRGWIAAATTDDRRRHFEASGSPPPVRLHLYPPAMSAVRGFGLVETAANGLVYRVVVEAAIPRGRPSHLFLRATSLPAGATLNLELPPGTTATDRVHTASERSWDLDVAASAGSLFRAALVVRAPLPGRVSLPSITCGAGNRGPENSGIVNWIGVPGRADLAIDGASPAAPADYSKTRRVWPGEIERLRRTGGSLWRVAASESPAVLRPPAPEASPTAPGGPAVPPKPVEAHPAADPTMFWSVTKAAAAGWWAAILAVAVLFAVLPHTTWPEQVGLLAGVIGFILADGAAPGIAVVAWAAARTVWLTRRLRMG
jgi:hypothetical protein